MLSSSCWTNLALTRCTRARWRSLGMSLMWRALMGSQELSPATWMQAWPEPPLATRCSVPWRERWMEVSPFLTGRSSLLRFISEYAQNIGFEQFVLGFPISYSVLMIPLETEQLVVAQLMWFSRRDWFWDLLTLEAPKCAWALLINAECNLILVYPAYEVLIFVLAPSGSLAMTLRARSSMQRFTASTSWAWTSLNTWDTWWRRMRMPTRNSSLASSRMALPLIPYVLGFFFFFTLKMWIQL